MGNLDIALWATGILVSVLLAFLAVKKINKNRSQVQKTSNKSSSIQAGRDVNINDR